MSDVEEYAERLRACVGSRGEPATIEVERGALRKFAVATGDPHPVHHGDLAAPTYVAALRSPLPDLPEPERPFRSHLHTNDELELHEPIRPGDVLTVTAELTDVFVKQGRQGPMLFTQVTFVTTRGDQPVSRVAWTEVQHR
ncbi:MaoC family dehydratase N-terminal domain-containing protein [Nocardioides sp. LHD-245]|uniref:FAS1-like dehydratase domain-containing protein n=1 Tax=Nocardioides sp. LHD-245 TaxID=3051387 RepID=UPI0027E19C15|nr:MaoC family dehydratase N-terminal domain-containing protein [Nocardioides sp. LHD-245]